MGQIPPKQDSEPWLKPPKNGPLSHGSNAHLTCRFSHVLGSIAAGCSVSLLCLRGDQTELLYNGMSSPI